MARKKVSVISESETGRNKMFRDNYTRREMNRSEFVKEIERGNYDGYHIRKINGKKTPISNPDGSEHNNLD
jgi:hypothetical protein